jgi:hypothetical protein
LSPTSGNTEFIGEQITVTKEIYFNPDDMFVVEEYFLENTGTVNLTDVQMMWHLMATPEATPSNPYYSLNDTELNFKYFLKNIIEVNSC